MTDPAATECVDPRPPAPTYTRPQLLRLLRAYAKGHGWNAHPLVLRVQADLWLTQRAGVVGQAILEYAGRRRGRRRATAAVAAVVLAALLAVAVAAACLRP